MKSQAWREQPNPIGWDLGWIWMLNTFSPLKIIPLIFYQPKRQGDSHRIANIILWGILWNDAHKSQQIHSWERNNKGWFCSGLETPPGSHNSWEVEAGLIKMLPFLASNFICSSIYHTLSATASLKLRTMLLNRATRFSHSYFFALRNPIFVASSNIAAC